MQMWRTLLKGRGDSHSTLIAAATGGSPWPKRGTQTTSWDHDGDPARTRGLPGNGKMTAGEATLAREPTGDPVAMRETMDRGGQEAGQRNNNR